MTCPPPIAATEPAARIWILACDAECAVREMARTEEISDWLARPGHFIWLDIADPTAADFAMLREEFGFHPLSLEDAANQQQRPKVDEYPTYYYVVTYVLDGPDDALIEVDLFVGENYVVSTHPGRPAALAEARRRWERGGELLREGVGFLVYTITDAIIDTYFPAVDRIEDEIDATQEAIFTRFQPDAVRQLLALKGKLFEIRRVLYPLRETFNTFLRRDRPIFRASSFLYFQDVYDHVLRLLDVVDIQREMLTGTLDAYLSAVSNRLSETVQRLTVLAVCLTIGALVFGAFGMNLPGIPWAQHPQGFAVVVAMTLFLVGVTLSLARWRRWL